MTETVIVSAARTPFGRMGGSLVDFTAMDLGAFAIKGALDQVKLNPELVEIVVGGHVLTAAQGQMTPRQAAIKAGIPKKTWSIQLNKVCISSMYALEHADMLIKLGKAETVVVVGQESMSNAPYAMTKARFGYRMGDAKIVDCMVNDGLWDAFENKHMGLGTDEWAAKYGVTREQMDIWSARSHQRAAAAQAAGLLADELIAVEIPQKKGDPKIFDMDEGVRADTTVEKLAALKPAFSKDGTVTAGNASSINDGGAAAVLMSSEKAERLGLEPLATIVDYGWNAGDYTDLHMQPASSTIDALRRAGLKVSDMSLFEINEAFASVCVHSAKVLGLDWENAENINVNGGAIAFGHPIAVSGLRVVMTMMYELRRRGGGYGVAGICGGGGQGDSIIIKVG